MRRQIQKYSKDFTAVIVLAVIAIAVAGYILNHQRVRFPFIQESTFALKADFSTAQAVTPGQGQTVRVSGVRIGDISKVALHNGVATVTMAVDPEYKDLVRANATAFLRPKTGLKDMFVELDPGHSPAKVVKENFTIPVQNTLPDVNPDEVFSALDADTRDYLKLLVSGAGQGLLHRGHDLQEVFRRFEPTHRDLARITSQISKRHANLRRLINSLNVLNGTLAGKDRELSQLIVSSADVFRAFAKEQSSISRAVGALPGALKETTRTLGNVNSFAQLLGPTVEKLRPAVRSLNQANKAIAPFAQSATPQIKNNIRPFVRQARPVVRDLKPAATNLAKGTPGLTRSFVVLNHLFNMLGFNPNGQEGPDTSQATRDEGYLFYLAWLNHIGGALFSSADAHGSLRPVTVGAPCDVLQALADENGGPFVTGLVNILNNPAFCGKSG